MKDIQLRSVIIDNFRGMRHFETCFGENETIIVGDNATGKSSIFAAFLWCLFGKDEKDRKDFEIKPCVNGASVRVKTAVTVCLAINGMSHELRREFDENWVKHKGDLEETFEGNVTTCFWDEAPVTVTEYNKRVSEIIDGSMFKMLTNPFYFTSMNWKDQRTALFAIAPAMTDEEIAAKDERFSGLLDKLGGKSAADFRKETSNALKELRKRSAEIQPRIDECGKMIGDNIMLREHVEPEIARVKGEIADIDTRLSSLSKDAEGVSKKITAKRREMDKLKADADALVHNAEMEEEKRVRALNADRYALAERIERDISKAASDRRYLVSYKSQTNRYDEDLAKLKDEHQKLVERYLSIEAETFSHGDLRCPSCGQILPVEKVEEAKAGFNLEKQRRLESVENDGMSNKNRIMELEKELERRKAETARMENCLIALDMSIADDKKRLSEMDEVKAEEVKPESLEGYGCLMDDIERIKGEIEELDSCSDDAETRHGLFENKRELQRELENLNSELRKIEDYERAKNRIAELEEEGRRLAQQIADYEKRVFAIDSFEIAKVHELEKHVNSMFDMVSWKLFDKTIEGNTVETCVAIVGDALYPVANSAARINAGLDIINTLSRHHGVRCPIFIDNAEGVTSIKNYGLQLVKMYVEKGAKLEVRETV